MHIELNELFQLIGGEIKKSGLAGLTPAGLVICGGGALTTGIIESAKRTLSMPVRIGYPVDITGLIDDIENPSFASAVGLLRLSLEGSEQRESGSSIFKNTLSKLPMKGMVGKLGDLFKSLPEDRKSMSYRKNQFLGRQLVKLDETLSDFIARMENTNVSLQEKVDVINTSSDKLFRTGKEIIPEETTQAIKNEKTKGEVQ